MKKPSITQSVSPDGEGKKESLLVFWDWTWSFLVCEVHDWAPGMDLPGLDPILCGSFFSDPLACGNNSPVYKIQALGLDEFLDRKPA